MCSVSYIRTKYMSGAIITHQGPASQARGPGRPRFDNRAGGGTRKQASRHWRLCMYTCCGRVLGLVDNELDG